MRHPVLTITTVITAMGAFACSNPRCWTHDASEVGDCSLFPSSSSSGGGRSTGLRDDVRAGIKARIERQRPACAAGNAIACSNIANQTGALDDVSPMEKAAAMAVACRAKVKVTRSNVHVCHEAAAFIRTESTADARALYEIGCELGITLSCTEASSLGSTRVFEIVEAGCARGQLESCDALLAFYTDPKGPHFDTSKAHEHLLASCRRDNAASCEQLGREAAR